MNSSKDEFNSYESFDPSNQPEYLNLLTSVLVPPFIIFSCYGNISSLLITKQQGDVWLSVNTMIMNISFCNLFITIIPPVSFLTETILKRWVFGTGICSTTVFLQYLFLSVIHTSMIITAYERYQCVSNPFKWRIIKKRKVQVMLALTWLFAIPVPVSVVYYHNPNVTFRSGYKGCLNTWIFIQENGNYNTAFIYALCLFSVLFLAPLLGLIVLYTLLAIKLRRRKPPGDQSEEMNLQRKLKNKKVILILISTVCLFQISWVPTWTQQFLLLSRYHSSQTDIYIIDAVFNSIAYAHTALSPWIYPVFLENYALYYKEQLSMVKSIFCKCCRKVNAENVPS